VKNIRQVRRSFPSPWFPSASPGPRRTFRHLLLEKGRPVADPKNWVYDFEKDLPAGIRCEFTLKPGLKTLSGKEIGEAKTFAFSTGGPA